MDSYMHAVELMECLEANPIIASVKDDGGLKQALTSDCRVIFTLFGDILSIAAIVERIKRAGKVAFVHIDLVAGLSPVDVSVDFIAQRTGADGILSTKGNLIRRAGACHFLAIQRYFLLDSMSMANIARQHTRDVACALEILPGVMPKAITRLKEQVNKPIITGGMVYDKEDVVQMLRAGACAVSSTTPEVWFS